MGKANNLRSRVSSYLGKRAELAPRTKILVSKIAHIDHTVVASELEALLLEAHLIKTHMPAFNVAWTDGKAYPFIKITAADTYPAVLQTRRIDDPKAIFFGPFPNIGDVRRILKWARRIFPYQSVRKHPKRICLYHHLGLCPCPPMLTKEQLTKYRRTIGYLMQFLEGKKESVMRKLEKEMLAAAKKEAFEEAEAIKRQIDTIRLITASIQKPWNYIDNPNLVLDEAKEDLESLQQILSTYFRGSTPHGESSGQASTSLSRIECYDISNIGGKEATGSMVVATDGQIDKSQYRRFRIRFKTTPDDVAMHREMLTRRLKHTEWPMPDLIVIDGGVGQVYAAMRVVEKHELTIPIIGLAKRLEEIIVPRLILDQGSTLTKTSVIRLPRHHRALKLLQRLRDEAHRFALAYHRKLRRKSLFKSVS